MEIEKKSNYDKINFGLFKGKNWNDLPTHYLEYLVSDKCMTYQSNKDIAKKVLQNKKIIDGQIKLL